jgi:hypothetical protein
MNMLCKREALSVWTGDEDQARRKSAQKGATNARHSLPADITSVHRR